jgi:hypothetical protein
MVRSERRSNPQRRERAHRPEPDTNAKEAARPAAPLTVERQRVAPSSSETAFQRDHTAPTGAGAGAPVSPAAAAVGSFAFLLAGLCFVLAGRRPLGRRLSLAPAPCTSALLFAAVERPG